MALSFPATESRPHFDRVGFKVIGKRMYASYLAIENTADIFLSIEEQKAFCKIDQANIFPLPNKWGEKGATTFVLDKVDPEVVMEALRSAYNEVIRMKKK